MKLDEIILTSANADIPYSHAVEFLKALVLKSKFVSNITSKLALHTIEDSFYVLVKDEQGIGFIELGKPLHLNKTRYNTLKIIYVLPEYRKTMAVGAFLIAMKQHMPNPIILGSDSHGGVLFNDGVELVHQMNKSARFDVKYLDLKTGKKREFDILEPGKYETLVFENTEFPLSMCVADNAVLFVLEGCENEITEGQPDRRRERFRKASS